MDASDVQRLLEWLLWPSIPMLYGLAVLWVLTPTERLVDLVFVGFQADPAGIEAPTGYRGQNPDPRLF